MLTHVCATTAYRRCAGYGLARDFERAAASRDRERPDVHEFTGVATGVAIGLFVWLGILWFLRL